MPYCRKCGKKIETADTLCDDCRNAELIFGEFSTPGSPAAPAVPAGPADMGNRMDGFPKALTSVIVSTVAAVIAVVAYVVLAGYCITGGEGTPAAYALPILAMLLSVGGVVVSIIFGVKSIAKFVDSKRRGKIKPVATLVCGIVGCAVSAFALVYAIVIIPFLAIL